MRLSAKGKQYIKRSLNFIKNMLNESIYVAYINKKSQQNQNAGFSYINKDTNFAE